MKIHAIFALSMGLLLLPPCASPAEVILAGLPDDFDGVPDPATPGPELARVLSEFRGTQDFDLIPNVGAGKADRQIAHTMTGLSADMVSATIEFHALAGDASGTNSDGFFLAFTTPSHEDFAEALAYRRSFGSISAIPPHYPFDDPGLTGTWDRGDEVTITLDLGALPMPDGTTIDLLPAIRALGFLDVVISDDTGVDYYELSYTTTPVGAGLADLAAIDRLSASPNPFRHETKIGFALSVRSDVTVRIFEVSGRLVRTLSRSNLSAGEQAISWDGRDNAGRDAATGVFFYRVESAGRAETERVVRLR